MFLRDCWYAAGWSRDLRAAEITAIMLLGEALALYRGANGKLVALEDRCCHRLAPLSKGEIEGNDLRCMDHGLKFDGAGRCIEIPGQNAIPAQARVRSYPIVEKHSIAWIWMGEPRNADESLIPDFVGVDDPNWAMLPGHLDFDAHYMLINDNLLDMSHLSFVHRKSFGLGSTFSEIRATVTRIERGLKVQRWAVDQPVPRYLSDVLSPDMRLDLWTSYDFLVPGIFLLNARYYPTGVAARCGDKPPTDEPLHQEFTCQAVSPLTEKTSRYFFANGPWARVAHLKQFFLDFSYMAFNEDKAIIEAQQRVIAQAPDRPMLPTTLDAGPSRFRVLMEKMIKDEAAVARLAATA